MIAARSAVGVYSWRQNTKRKTNTEKMNVKGFINSTVLIVALLSVCAAVYLYSINSSASKGYQMRHLCQKNL